MRVLVCGVAGVYEETTMQTTSQQQIAGKSATVSLICSSFNL